MNKASQQYLKHFLKTLTKEQRKNHNSYSSEYFCSNEKDANDLAQLVLNGNKTATCSLKYWYDNDDNAVKPQIGHLMVMTNFYGKPLAVLATISVDIMRFSDVGADFAFLEGEGDKSLKFWQKAHKKYFIKECLNEGIEFDNQMLLYLEKFKVVYS